MATGLSVIDMTFIAGADLSAKLYFAVKKDTSGNKVVLAGAGDPVLGILQGKPASGDAAIVRILGESPVVAGTGDFAEGDLVASDANGKVITAASGKYVFGIAKSAGNSGTGKLGTVVLLPQGKV